MDVSHQRIPVTLWDLCNILAYGGKRGKLQQSLHVPQYMETQNIALYYKPPWSGGNILAQNARGPGFDTRTNLQTLFTLEMWKGIIISSLFDNNCMSHSISRPTTLLQNHRPLWSGGNILAQSAGGPGFNTQDESSNSQ